MRILSVVLHKYIPLLHGGIHKLSIDILSNVCVLIGNNGSGKSSVLRELSVFPSTSTDYEKGGGKSLVIEHEESKYELSSIFEGHKGSHSFVKDGIELNDSKNSTTQASLCEAYFGINNLIRDLTSGNINFCTLSKVERKSLLAACYPSDLTFVLKYHQKISSRVRSIKTNIKMLMSRQLELQNEMMNEQEFEHLRKLVDKLNVFRQDIDLWIRDYTREIRELEEHSGYKDYRQARVILSNEELQQEIRRQRATHQSLLCKYPELTTGDLNENIIALQSTLSVRREMLNGLQEQVSTITKEIDEYEHLADRNVEDELAHVEKELNGLRTDLANIHINENIPVKPPVFTGDFSLEKLQKAVSLCHGTQDSIYSSNRLRQELQKEQDLLVEISVLNRDIASLTDNKNRLETKLARYRATASPNAECRLPCMLKDNALKSITEVEEDLASVTAALSQLQPKHTGLSNDLKSLQQSLQGPLSRAKVVSWLEDIVTRLNNDEYLLQQLSLEELLNQQPVALYNRISAWIENQQKYVHLQELQDKLSAVEYKKKVIIDSKLPAKDLISKNLIEKKASLLTLSSKYIAMSKWLIQKTDLLNAYKSLQALQQLADRTYLDHVSKFNYDILATKIEQLRELIAELNRYRRLADEKQNEIKGTVKTQEHHRIRLNEEIMPSVHRLTEELKIVEAIESALSPTSGLPHTYMTRFINGRINAVNEYIRAVWNKDMELQSISEDNELDFVFPVSHSRQSEVKDIAICSKGEQEIINLAWTLALCSQMQLGINYPIRLDECDSGMTPGHRQNLLSLLSTLTRQGDIKQLFLVNHHSSLFTAFSHSQIVCLNPDGIILPANYNEGVSIN